MSGYFGRFAIIHTIKNLMRIYLPVLPRFVNIFSGAIGNYAVRSAVETQWAIIRLWATVLLLFCFTKIYLFALPSYMLPVFRIICTGYLLDRLMNFVCSFFLHYKEEPLIMKIFLYLAVCFFYYQKNKSSVN